MGVHLSTLRYQPTLPIKDAALRKRVYRIYKLAGLNLRSKRPKRSRAAAHREVAPQATTPNEA